MTDTVNADDTGSTKSKKNVPSVLATISALFALGAAAVPFAPQLPPIYVLGGLIPSAVLAFLAASGFSKLRQEDRQRRMRLAKALERWQKEAQEQAKETERQSKLRQLIALDLQKEKDIAQNYLDVANIFLAAIDSDGLVEVINRKGIEILGCQERDILGEDFAKFCVPDPYREKVAGELTMALKGHKQILARTEYPISTAQGERLISWSNALVKDANGKPKAILLCGEDVTDRRSVEARLQLMRMMLESVDEGVIAIDAKGLVVWANPACERITGFAVRAIQGRAMGMIYPTETGATDLSNAMTQMMEKGTWKGEIFSRHKSGKAYPQRLSLAAIKDQNTSKVTHAVAVFSDITKEKEQEERVRYLASHDTLTGLPNRASFTNRLDQALAFAKANGKKMAILFIDLDHFKKVNDTLGHEAGDHLLIEVAQRLKATLREKDFIARLGGDEFTAIIENFDRVEDAQSSANKLLNALSEKYAAVGDNADIRVTPSIGICMYPDDGLDAQSLLKKSDQAMYAVKSSGRAGVRFFTPDINAKELQYAQLEVRMKKALQEDTLELYYQPKIDLKTHQLQGFEALTRWSFPDGTPMNPEDFIAFAEESGLIIDLGYWVLEKAASQMLAWRNAGYGNINIGVNVSARQFKDSTLSDRLAQIIKTYDLQPGQLELELTESSLMKESKDAVALLHKFKDLGCVISIDDFGTGYSSLLRMRELPIDAVKIDKGFVLQATSDNSDGAICRAVVGLARALDLKIVAEGVETPEHVAFLSGIGTHYGQGFLFAPAMPPEEATKWLLQKQNITTKKR